MFIPEGPVGPAGPGGPTRTLCSCVSSRKSKKITHQNKPKAHQVAVTGAARTEDAFSHVGATHKLNTEEHPEFGAVFFTSRPL